MSKKDLEARIAALEAEIVQLRLQVAQKQQPVVLPAPSYPYYPYGWYPPYTQIWCSTTTAGPNTSLSLKGTIGLLADDAALEL